MLDTPVGLSRDAGVRPMFESWLLVSSHVTLRVLLDLRIEVERTCDCYMSPLKGIIPISQGYCKD